VDLHLAYPTPTPKDPAHALALAILAAFAGVVLACAFLAVATAEPQVAAMLALKPVCAL